MSYELDYKLAIDVDGVIEVDQDNAIGARVAEWLDTPKGEVWGAPQWGNNLTQYRHEPVNSDTEAAIENSIMLSLPTDVSGVVINAISAKATEFDKYEITIQLPTTTIVKEVTL